jgi:acylphosphatase
MTDHINVSVYGDVQGVFFRRTIKHEGNRRGVKGFVENKPDGSVYIEMEGTADELAAFIAWIESGADGHTVKRIDQEPGPFKAFDSFEVKE